MTNAEILEKIEPGMILSLGSHKFTREEITRFASKFDPQPFHLDEEAAKKSNFGTLCASGWHTASVWMRKNIENGAAEYERLIGAAPKFGPSPGVRNLRWHRPVYVGETIHFTTRIVAKRSTSGRSGYAMILSHSEGRTESDELVLSMVGAATLRV